MIYPEEFLQSPGELSQALFSSDKEAVHVTFGKSWSLGNTSAPFILGSETANQEASAGGGCASVLLSQR